MKASKGNKVYTIEETMKEQYQKNGYDIYSDDGSILAYGKGKTVAYEEYAKVMKEYQDLLKRYEELKTKSSSEEKKGKQTKKEGE